jgi:hypothetical protein
MSSIALKVVVHGLIALIPNQHTPANLMTALLVDGGTASSMPGMDCMLAHHPQLKILATTPTQCNPANCTVVGNECTCSTDSLRGKLLTLTISPTPTPTGQDLAPPIPHSLPETGAEAANFSYVANLSRSPFGLTLNQSYLTTTPPSNLLARMDFPFDQVAACALAKRPDGGLSNVHALSFRKLHTEGLIGETSQALAQMVVARLNIPDGGGTPQKVTLNISNFDGTASTPVDLMAEDDGYLIELSNDSTSLRPDSPCDDGVARHFGRFYDLATTSIPSADRLIPHLRLTQWISADNLEPDLCKAPTFNPTDRPMCPMASFDHP